MDTNLITNIINFGYMATIGIMLFGLYRAAVGDTPTFQDGYSKGTIEQLQNQLDDCEQQLRGASRAGSTNISGGTFDIKGDLTGGSKKE